MAEFSPITVSGLLQGEQTTSRSAMYEALGPQIKPYLGRKYREINTSSRNYKIALVVSTVLAGIVFALTAGLGAPTPYTGFTGGVFGGVVLASPVVLFLLHRQTKQFNDEALDWTGVIRELVPIYHNLSQKLAENREDEDLQALVERFAILKAIEYEGGKRVYRCRTDFGDFVVGKEGNFLAVMGAASSEGSTDMVEYVVRTLGNAAAGAVASQMVKSALTAAAFLV